MTDITQRRDEAYYKGFYSSRDLRSMHYGRDWYDFPEDYSEDELYDLKGGEADAREYDAWDREF